MISEHKNTKKGLIEIVDSDKVFDVFITDMFLPDSSGRELVKLVQKNSQILEFILGVGILQRKITSGITPY